jgi:3-isopropylmalate/(R)-2-methylmalate dehydratase small subunit
MEPRMDKFVTLDALAAPLPHANVDTDQIIPARFLARPREAGLAPFLFHDLRRASPDGETFVLDRPAYRAARILVAGPNFGCGSSREHAVCALLHSGIAVVIAANISAIFVNNALENGLLPVSLDTPVVQALLDWLADTPDARLVVDLEGQRVALPAEYAGRTDVPLLLAQPMPFAVEARYRHCLLQGIDAIQLTLQSIDEIESFETRHESAGTAPVRHAAMTRTSHDR